MTDPEVRLTVVAAAWFDAAAPYDLGPDRDRLLRELLLTTGVCTLRRDQVVFAHQSFAELISLGFSGPTTPGFSGLVDLVNTLDPKLVAAAMGLDPQAPLIYLADRIDPGLLEDLGAETSNTVGNRYGRRDPQTAT